MTKKTVTKKASKNKPLDFEASIKNLEQLVERMEQGETSLEQSLKDFEEGIVLFRQCQQALDEAQQRVQILMEKNGEQRLEPFEEQS